MIETSLAAPGELAPAPAGRFTRILRALGGNPVFLREVGVSLGGTKFALVFLLVNAALIVSTVSTIVSGIAGELYQTPGGTGLGLALASINGCVIYGLLAVLLPLRVVGLFEGARLDHAFDQVVVSGVPPGRLHAGNWGAALTYAAVVLFATLPYQAFAYACQGVSALSIAHDYAILLAYSNVIVLVTMALGVALSEFGAAPLAILGFTAAGALSFAPLPSAIAHWTPIRHLCERGAFFAEAPFRDLYSAPYLFTVEVPDGLVMGAWWGLLILGALVYLVLGPMHTFTPGLNNFGQVVLPGDRKRSRLRTLRFHLTRRVEMAFLYENRSPRWAPWDWPLRTLALLAFTFAWWTVTIGVWFHPQMLAGAWRFQDEHQVSILLLSSIGLAFALISYGESRDRVHALERVGPLLVPRGLLSFPYFAIVLAGFCAFAYLPLAIMLGRQLAGSTPAMNARSRVPAEVALAALPEQVAIIALFAVTLYLLGRLLGHLVRTARAMRSMLVAGSIILLIAPMVLVPFHLEGLIPGGMARAAFASPVLALLESFDPGDSLFKPEALGSGLRLFFWIHGSLCLSMALGLLALSLLHYRVGARFFRDPGGVGGVAAALAVFLGASGLRGDEVSAEVVRAFQGHAFSDFEHFTVVLSRGEPISGAGGMTGTAEVWLESSEGGRPYSAPMRVEVPPGTKTLLRLAVEPRGDNQGPFEALRLVVRHGGARRELEVPPASLEPDETVVRFLVVSEEGAVPPLALSGHRWVGCRPAWLPERPEAYAGADLVLVGPTDLGAWTSLQRRALLDFVRFGGAVIFFGAIDERGLGSTPEWAELLRPAGPSRTEASGIPVRVHPLRGAAVTWKEGAGTEVLPLLSVLSVGPGKVGHLAVDPLEGRTAARFGGPERFWRALEKAAPFSLCSKLPLLEVHAGPPPAGGKSLLWVAAYFVAYTLVLGPGMFLLFRARRRRVWAWAYAPAASVCFVLGAPLLFLAMQADPSSAMELGFTFFGSEGHAARHTFLAVSSSGRQDHRLSFRGDDLSAFAGGEINRRRRGRRWQSPELISSLSTLRTAPSPGRLEVPEFPISPWGNRTAWALSRERREAPVRGRVVARAKGNGWSYEVEGLPAAPAPAAIVIFSPQAAYPPSEEESKAGQGKILEIEPGPRYQSMRITVGQKSGGGARGTIPATAGEDGWLGFNFNFGFAQNRLARPRAFAIWQEAAAGAVVESDDLFFAKPYGRVAVGIMELEVVIPGEKPDGTERER